MRAFDVLGEPVRRRIMELLAEEERSAGDVSDLIGAEFGISQPAVSQHLRVLRESGLADARAKGTRRLYSVRPEPLQDIDVWLDRFRGIWAPHFETLAAELGEEAFPGERLTGEQLPGEQLPEEPLADEQFTSERTAPDPIGT